MSGYFFSSCARTAVAFAHSIAANVRAPIGARLRMAASPLLKEPQVRRRLAHRHQQAVAAQAIALLTDAYCVAILAAGALGPDRLRGGSAPIALGPGPGQRIVEGCVRQDNDLHRM